MNLTQEKALFHLTGKLGIGAPEISKLQKVADESPYFAPARFLLTAALKQSRPVEQWIPHAQKTQLYFTNTGWLQYQLEEVDTTPAESAQTTPVVYKESFIATEEPTEAETAPQTVEEVIEPLPLLTEPTPEEHEEPLDTGDPDETDAPELPEEPMASESKISGLLQSQLADFRKPVAADAALEIDADKKPLHTVDYFVSQGIRVDLAAMPQDKLTTHLRKFTDWLKQVKNSQNHANPQDLGTNLEMEKAVAETARHSNETREVVTESMADVLVKQGQVEKAIQLYIKLSFLNPEKSSYFAAKIEQLKGI